jgi:acyl dehydratase
MPEVIAPSRTIAYADLADSLGVRFGPTPWTMVTQAQVDAFADVTHDHQWIHVDEERARQGPFGTTIAHGYLTLSLVPFLLGQLLEVTGVSMAVNYGLEKVRFPAPVPVGAKVRATGTLKDVEQVAGGLQCTLSVTVEREGGEKPVCIAEPVFRYYGG